MNQTINRRLLMVNGQPKDFMYSDGQLVYSRNYLSSAKADISSWEGLNAKDIQVSPFENQTSHIAYTPAHTVAHVSQTERLVPNTRYILSFTFKSYQKSLDKGNYQGHSGLLLYVSPLDLLNGEFTGKESIVSLPSEITSGTRVEIPFKSYKNATTVYFGLNFAYLGNMSESQFDFIDMKLEREVSTHEWTPASQDFGITDDTYIRDNPFILDKSKLDATDFVG